MILSSIGFNTSKYEWYPWLYPHFEQLINSYQIGWGHRALLIRTSSGMGDQSLIYAIIRFILCQNTHTYKICGKCRACYLMQANTHPDYYVISIKKDETSINIDNIREISKNIYEHSKLEGFKIVWLKDINLFTESAFNAILRILKNPPGKTWFFLSSYNSDRLLKPMYGSCFLYRLITPQESLTSSWLIEKTKMSKESVITALRIYDGAPITALEMLRSVMWLQRTKMCKLLNQVIENRNWLSMVELLNQNQVTNYLHWIISLLLDALKVQQKTTLISNLDSLQLVNMLAYFFSSKTLLTIVHEICECRKILLNIAGINCELLLTNQLLRIEDYLQYEVKPYF